MLSVRPRARKGLPSAALRAPFLNTRDGELTEQALMLRTFIVRIDATTLPPQDSWDRVTFHATGIATRGGKIGRTGYVTVVATPSSGELWQPEPKREETAPLDESLFGTTLDTPAEQRAELAANVEKLAGIHTVETEEAAVILTDKEAREDDEIDIEEIGPPQPIIEGGEAAPAGLAVRFNEQTRKFYARVKGKDRIIRNAKDFYLLPGDRLAASTLSGDDLMATEVDYRRTPYIAGFIAKNPGRNGSFYYSVRVPGKRTLEKFKLSVNAIPDAEAAYRERRVILFDRRTRSVIDHPAMRAGESDYENLKRVALTNMGTYEYDEESEEEKQREQEEISWLAREYGANNLSEDADIDAQIEPAMARMADEAVAAGDVEDLRDTLNGKRRTYYVDPFGSRDHDDALSIENKGDGAYQIGIHIADVARFVAAGSALDLQARFRASSIYLDDEVIRMFPPLISEHLASLNAGSTRFAFSLLLDVREDDKKHIRVEGMRFAKTAIRVTDGLTYDEAEENMGNDPALAKLMSFAKRLRARKGIRQPGDEEVDPSQMDMHQMVAEYMTTKSRIAGAAYERFKRANPETEPNLYAIQNLVLGVYRVQELAPDSASQHLRELTNLGILTREDQMHNGKPATTEWLLKIARSRVDAGGYYAPGPEGLRWQEFTEREIETYYRSSFFAKKGPAGYQSTPGGHFSMGSIQFSRVTSPIRREADLRGQRRLQFLGKIRRAASKTDLSEQDLRAFVREYVEDVIGLRLAEMVPNNESMSAAALLKAVAKRAREQDARDLAHDSARERLAQDAERVVGSLHTAANLYEFLYGATWERGSERQPSRSYKLEQRSNGEAVPEGLVIDLTEDGDRVSADGEVYGEVVINKRSNRALSRFVPGRLREIGARLQVKFFLPEGAIHPAIWCDQEGIYPRRVKVSGSIVGVQVEQGRIVFRLSPNGSYMDPRGARRPRSTAPREPERRQATSQRSRAPRAEGRKPRRAASK